MTKVSDMLILAVPLGALVAYFTDCAGMCPGLRAKIDGLFGFGGAPVSPATTPGSTYPFPYPYATSSVTYHGMAANAIPSTFQPIPRFSSSLNLRAKDWVAV